jgi:hypothetical protein
LVVNGVAQAARQEITVSSLTGVSWDTTGESAPTVIGVRAFDGTLWSDWTSVTINLSERAPIVHGLGPTIHGGSVLASSLFGASDPENDAITGWDLWDPLAGNGNFVVGGIAQGARQEITVSSLAGVSWDTTGESGPTVIGVRAFDGTLWSDWTNVAIDDVEQAPRVSGTGAPVHGVQQVALASLVGAADPDSDAITAWDLWDPLAGNGGLVVGGIAQGARQEITVASLAGVSWDTTGESGPTVIGVRAFDGTLWSDWTSVAVNARDSAPVVHGANLVVTGGTVAAASLVGANDPDNDPITAWGLWDPLAGNGNLVVDGIVQNARQEITVASLAGVSWDTTGESGPTVIGVRAFDGTLWSDWVSVAVNDAGPLTPLAPHGAAPAGTAASRLVSALAAMSPPAAPGLGTSPSAAEPSPPPALAAAPLH